MQISFAKNRFVAILLVFLQVALIPLQTVSALGGAGVPIFKESASDLRVTETQDTASASEVGFVSHSPRGALGGVIIPASCESGLGEGGVAHFQGVDIGGESGYSPGDTSGDCRGPENPYDPNSIKGMLWKNFGLGGSASERTLDIVASVLQQAENANPNDTLYTPDVLARAYQAQLGKFGGWSGNEDPSDQLLKIAAQTEATYDDELFVQFRDSPSGVQWNRIGQQLWNQSQVSNDSGLGIFMAIAGIALTVVGVPTFGLTDLIGAAAGIEGTAVIGTGGIIVETTAGQIVAGLVSTAQTALNVISTAQQVISGNVGIGTLLNAAGLSNQIPTGIREALGVADVPLIPRDVLTYANYANTAKTIVENPNPLVIASSLLGPVLSNVDTIVNAAGTALNTLASLTGNPTIPGTSDYALLYPAEGTSDYALLYPAEGTSDYALLYPAEGTSDYAAWYPSEPGQDPSLEQADVLAHLQQDMNEPSYLVANESLTDATQDDKAKSEVAEEIERLNAEKEQAMADAEQTTVDAEANLDVIPVVAEVRYLTLPNGIRLQQDFDPEGRLIRSTFIEGGRPFLVKEEGAEFPKIIKGDGTQVQTSPGRSMSTLGNIVDSALNLRIDASWTSALRELTTVSQIEAFEDVFLCDGRPSSSCEVFRARGQVLVTQPGSPSYERLISDSVYRAIRAQAWNVSGAQAIEDRITALTKGMILFPPYYSTPTDAASSLGIGRIDLIRVPRISDTVLFLEQLEMQLAALPPEFYDNPNLTSRTWYPFASADANVTGAGSQSTENRSLWADVNMVRNSPVASISYIREIIAHEIVHAAFGDFFGYSRNGLQKFLELANKFANDVYGGNWPTEYGGISGGEAVANDTGGIWGRLRLRPDGFCKPYAWAGGPAEDMAVTAECMFVNYRAVVNAGITDRILDAKRFLVEGYFCEMTKRPDGTCAMDSTFWNRQAIDPNWRPQDRLRAISNGVFTGGYVTNLESYFNQAPGGPPALRNALSSLNTEGNRTNAPGAVAVSNTGSILDPIPAPDTSISDTAALASEVTSPTTEAISTFAAAGENTFSCVINAGRCVAGLVSDTASTFNIIFNPPQEIHAGGLANLTGTINNSGSESVPPMSNKFQVFDHRNLLNTDSALAEVATTSPEVGPNQTIELTAQWQVPATFSPGEYFVRLCVDVGNTVAETNNGNNCGALKPFIILPVVRASAPSPALASSKVKNTASVASNLGQVAAITASVTSISTDVDLTAGQTDISEAERVRIVICQPGTRIVPGTSTCIPNDYTSCASVGYPNVSCPPGSVCTSDGRCQMSSAVCQPTFNTPCESTPNSCGQRNTASYTCDGTCPAIPPLESSCRSAVTCPALSLCSGSDVYDRGTNCASTFREHCQYGCLSGVCQPPPPPTPIEHLQAKPSLLRGGNIMNVRWEVTNAASCTVYGTNGDGTGDNATGVWNTLSSGPDGKTSSPITEQTTYTLSCLSLPGATTTSFSESKTVNIVPVYQ